MRASYILSMVVLASSHGNAAPLPALVDIELRSSVAVLQPTVSLGDLAFVRTSDLESMRRLVALPVGTAPRTGTEIAVDRVALARWIRTRLPNAHGQIVWRGSDRVIVSSRRGSGTGIRAGESLMLRLQSGPVQVDRRVEVLQDAALGEVVRVRVQGATAPVEARVVSRERAEAL